MGLIQSELDDVQTMWKNNRIRPVKNSYCPRGRPEVLYFAPHLSSGRDCSYSVIETGHQSGESYSEDPTFLGCSKEFLELSTIINNDHEGKRD